MTRSIGVTYAGLIIGKDQVDDSYNLAGKIRYREQYDQASIEFEVVVSNSNQTTFLAAEAALRAAYTKPDQALTAVLGSATRYAADPTAGASGNTGFLTRPSCRKQGSAVDTAYSSLWLCTVAWTLPADLSGRSGRRDGAIEISTNPAGIRTVTFVGTYTALTSNDSYAQYLSAVDTWISSELPAGTFELVGIPQVRYDDQDKILIFRHVYKEVIANQAVGVLDHASIVNPRLIVRRQRSSADQTATFAAESLIGLVAQFSCSVDIAQSTDLKTTWETVIRPRVFEAVRELSGISALAWIAEDFSPDIYENTISATLGFQGSPSPGLHQARIETDDDNELGKILYPVLNGNPFARDLHHGPQTWVRTLYRTFVGIPSAVSAVPPPPAVAGYIHIKEGYRRRRFPIGLPEGPRLDLLGVTERFVYVRAEVESVETGSPGIGGTTGNVRGGGGYPVDTDGV